MSAPRAAAKKVAKKALVKKEPARKAPAVAKAAVKKAPAKKTRAPAGKVDPLERLRSICLALPEAVEGTNHSAPCFMVGGKTFVMFVDNHHGDGRLAIWCKAPPGAQQMIVEADPVRFFVPPYVGPRGWIGARLDRNPDWSLIASCAEESWTLTAPKRLLATRAR